MDFMRGIAALLGSEDPEKLKALLGENIPQGNPLTPPGLGGPGMDIPQELPPAEGQPIAPTMPQMQAPMVAPPETVGDTIEVMGSRYQEPTYEAPKYNINPDSIPDGRVMIDQAAPDMSPLPRGSASPQELAGTRNYDNLDPHKGMFGLKGTMRDILGTLGDAMLIGGGGKAMYTPQKQQERMGDAMVGFGSGDEVTDLAVLRRVAQQDPVMAQKLLDQMNQRKYQQAQAQNAQEKTKQDAQTDAQKAYDTGSKIYGSALRGMGPGKYNKPMLDAIAKQYGLPADLFNAPEQFDGNWAEPYIRQGTPVNQQENTAIREEQGNRRLNLTEQQGNARIGETGRHNRVNEKIAQQRANKPAAGREPRSRTDQETFIEIGRKVEAGKPLAQYEKDFYKKYTQGTGKKGGSGLLDAVRGGSTAPAAGKSGSGKFVVRNGKLVPK